MNLSKEEIFAYNTGIKMAQWQVTKAMLGMRCNGDLSEEIKILLKYIHDEIEKEIK